MYCIKDSLIKKQKQRSEFSFKNMFYLLEIVRFIGVESIGKQQIISLLHFFTNVYVQLKLVIIM